MNKYDALLAGVILGILLGFLLLVIHLAGARYNACLEIVKDKPALEMRIVCKE